MVRQLCDWGIAALCAAAILLNVQRGPGSSCANGVTRSTTWETKSDPTLVSEMSVWQVEDTPSHDTPCWYMNAPSSGAEMQTFDWLSGKLDQCIHDSQQEANAISIHERLRKVSGMTVPRVVRMGRATGSYPRMARMAQVNPTPVPNQVINGGSNDQSKSSSSHAKTLDLTPARKEEMPCIYFSPGKCFQETCFFKHDPSGKGAVV